MAVIVRLPAMERRDLMGANKLLAGCFVLLLSVSVWAQNSGSSSGQSSSQSSVSSSPSSQPSLSPSSSPQSDQAGEPASDKQESSSRHSTHHIRVPVEEEDSQPPELREADSAIDKKDYATAELLLHKLVEREPSNYVGWFDLGFVENALGKTDDSIAAYRKSVAAKPDVFESNLNLGLQLAKTRQPDAATFLQAATHLKPTSHVEEGLYRAWLALGRITEKSNPEEALNAYRQATSIQPKEAEPHLCIGQILERGNKFAEAESEYKQALAFDPHSSDALVGLANVYMRARRFPEAEEYLRKLVVDQPDSAAVHIQLGRVLAAEGKTEEAVTELRAGIKSAPGDEEAEREVARLYIKTGKNDLAEAAYRRLVAVHAGDAELYRQLGETLLLEKKFPEAQQEFMTAVKLKPDLGEAYGGLAFAAGENQDYALALRALDARSKLLPDGPIVYFLRGSAYDHLRDYKKAATNYRLFLNAAQGKYPDQEWQAKHRLIAIEPKK
jgi:tetratricopeptide (TPR) repeat protein